MPRLAIIALPQEDESLFSWLSRFAALQDMTARRFLDCCNLSFPADPDRVYERGFFQELAELSEKSPVTLARLGFARYGGFLFEQDKANLPLPWLTRIRLPKKFRIYQLFFCPLCLKERAYFRLRWRLGFVFCCPRHRVWLVKGECCEDLSPLIRNASRGAKLLPASEVTIFLQSRWLEVLERGWVEMGCYGVQYSFVWLLIARVFTRLILEGGCFVEMRRIAEKALGLRHLPLDNFKAPGSSEKFYELSLQQRAHILHCVDWLMQDYPHRFVSICQDLHVASRFLGKRCKNSYPFALSDPLIEHLHRPHYIAPLAEVEALKEAIRDRTGGEASLKHIQSTAGYKLTTRRELSDSIHKGARYGEGRYWKLDGVAAEVKIAVRYQACREGVTVAHWVESILQKAIALASEEQMPNDRAYQAGDRA